MIGLWAIVAMLGCADDCTTSWYADLDGDGYGDRKAPRSACLRPMGFVADATDCDDADDTIHPDADDGCDGVDEDCDGEIDEDGDLETWYLDVDEDGRGSDASWTGCEAEPPPFYTASSSGDCDDFDPDVGPGTPERCNGRDDDCDGSIDEAAVDVQPFYVDIDLDGFGGEEPIYVCPSEQGYLAPANDDCDDLDAERYPGADEWCNGVDDDCDGLIDEGALDAVTGYPDLDGDGWGQTDAPVDLCPDAFDVVTYYGYPYTGVQGYVPQPGDCDDGDPFVFPTALERCNGRDDDCDGLVDDDDPNIAVDDLTPWYLDFDGDGWGDSEAWLLACEAPSGGVAWSAARGDCDDGDREVNPGADERCNGFDDDCDEQVDAADPELGACP